MKPILTFLAAAIAAALVLCLASAFAMSSINPSEWPPALRYFLTTAWAITVLYLVVELKPFHWERTNSDGFS